MMNWKAHLRYDPLPPLLESGHAAILFATRRDLLGEAAGPVGSLWRLPAVERLVRRQRPDGRFPYPGGGKPHLRRTEDYDQIETFRALADLVEKYGGTKALSAVEKAASFLFSRQTAEGDFRGIYGQQYTPNYSAAIMELLIKAGYGREPRIARGFRWMLTNRQKDGGWAIPMLTVRGKWDQGYMARPALAPDRDRPSSHMVTGIVLRAFAAHPQQRRSREAKEAAELLAGRLFCRDLYPGREKPEFWTKFSFPFWFTDLLSALDSLTLIGLGPEHPKVAEALEWLIQSQGKDGAWNVALLRSGGDKQVRQWVGLAICRVFKRLYGAGK
jgi:hypothetical protein